MTEKPCFVIAEAGVNHNGSLLRAKEMVEVAKHAGANAIKFQTFRTELLATSTAEKAEYQQQRTGIEQSQFEMLKGLELTYDEFSKLNDYCFEVGIEFLSTPFDEPSADFLDSLKMSRFKIPSGEVTNVRLIRHIARFGKQILMSTGMCSDVDIERALGWIFAEQRESKVWLLQCVSEYPAKASDTNLRAVETMRQKFGLPVGLSDHSLGYAIPLAAVALGAVVIEKHFTMDRGLPGPDHAASLDPGQLKSMISGIREVESAMGDGQKRPTPNEEKVAQVARRSIVAAHNIPVGWVLQDADLTFLRPGSGIEPRHYLDIIGRKTKRAIESHELLDWNMFE
jgi:N-acetylneuraminate synthase